MLGEKHEPIEEWAKPIIARGPRRRFEMEQVLPSSDPDEPDCDPIIEANALRDFGRVAQARRLLLRLIEQDPRCLDAHAHRGNVEFAENAEKALAHYATGVTICRRALGRAFDAARLQRSRGVSQKMALLPRDFYSVGAHAIVAVRGSIAQAGQT